MVASPQDFGRDYSLRENDTSVPLWLVILVGVTLWVIYKLIYSGVSKIDDANKKLKYKSLNANNPPISHAYRTQQGTLCPECNGKGYMKGPKAYSDRKYCTYCHGYGKKFSYTATQYYTDMLEESLKLRRELRQGEQQHDRLHHSVSSYLFSHIPSISQHLLDAELAHCDPCPYCQGAGEIRIDTFFDIDERMNIMPYEKLLCSRCKGIGYVD